VVVAAARDSIALYPGCGVVGARPRMPTLILVAELDDWNTRQGLRRAMAHWGNAGAPVELVTHPGAHHAFDVQIFQPGKMMFGHWTEYNAEAAKNAPQNAGVPDRLSREVIGPVARLR